MPYAKRDDFLSASEISFFHVLKSILTTDHYLLTKVNLADLFYVKRPHENKGARGRISQKHVDYVVCDAKTMAPLVAIELDDRSHEREDRKKRDVFVDRVFEAAGLPILHIPAAKGYVPTDIRALLQKHFSISEPFANTQGDVCSIETEVDPQSQGDSKDPTASAQNPICKRCGSPMTLRTASRGQNKGNQFWGCTNYPKCQYSIY